MADAALKAQAIQNPGQAESLIAIKKACTENALQLETAPCGMMKLRLAALLGVIGPADLITLVLATRRRWPARTLSLELG
ncbi:hypothetical protein [Streptomyces sp. NPDC051554]|uniref:hypothetical protein n=1 Tax=Streptomyces sp. NPDC051554 TaxID=3365656 RepID=UPI0037895B19